MNLIKNLTLLLALTLAVTSCKKDAVIPKVADNQIEKASTPLVSAIDCTIPATAWTKNITTTNPAFAIATSIVTDKSNNIYIAGVFKGTVDLDPGTGVYNVSGKGFYVQKLNANGIFQAAKKILIDFDEGWITHLNWDRKYTSLNVDASGNIYLTAYGHQIKTDKYGNIIYQKMLPGDIHPVSSVVDSQGYLITVGSYTGVVDINPGSGVYNTPGSYGVYMQRLDPNGNFNTAKFYDAMVIWDLEIDAADNVYATGQLKPQMPGSTPRPVFIKTNKSGVVTINKPGSATDFAMPLSRDNAGNLYMNIDNVPAKYNASAVKQWQAGFTHMQSALGIRAYQSDSKGNLYIGTGGYQEVDATEIYKLEPTLGNQLWKQSLPFVTYADDTMVMATDSQDNLIVAVNAGTIQGTRIIKYSACQ